MQISIKSLKKAWQVVFILLLNLLIISFFTTNTTYEVSALSKMGSRGNEVKQIQTKLKNWGYYKGNVDGIYGSQTKKAVVWFQKNNNLTADGIAGSKTLKAMGIASKSSGNSYNSDYNLLAKVISAEARGEPYSGQVAVGAVILNRVRHSSFPDTIAAVVYQPGAFTCMTDGQINAAVADSAYKAAQEALNGWDPSGAAIYYYNPKTAVNQWIRSRQVVRTIGTHVFCK